MSESRTVRLVGKGPAEHGLETWEEISPNDLIEGRPVQRGHLYYKDAERGLEVGVWDCTPMTTKLEPYSVNEFMHVLEGAVTIVYEDGSEDTISAGESFIIPKGTLCSWKQTDYIRKFFVIFDDPSGAAAEDPSALRVIKPDPAGPADGMGPYDPGDPADYMTDIPEMTAHAYFTDPTGQMVAGVWEAGPFERHTGPINRCELMIPVEGSMTLKGDGEELHFKTGEAAFVPIGAPYGWKSTETVRKIYCAFLPKQAATGEVEAAE